MQTKSLQQLKRALSAALFVLLLSVAGTKNALAQNQVATLQHADSISGVYYGQNALVSARNAAVDGDIITLSSGTFNSCNINKAIILRGACCTYDSLAQVLPTIIIGAFNIDVNNVSFEGIWFSGAIRLSLCNNISFMKCNVNQIEFLGYNGYNTGFQFVDCIIQNFRSTYNNNQTLIGMSIINSVVRFTVYGHNDITRPNIINNSIVLFNTNQPIRNIIAYNSIIATVSGHEISNCSFFNCIGIETGETLLFDGQTAQNVMEVSSYEDVFKTFDGTVTYDNVYQLKEEITTSFLGNDGTEVGIYGGLVPYRTRPDYMIIKNCNVAGRTTEDNKLSVEIELFNAGE